MALEFVLLTITPYNQRVNMSMHSPVKVGCLIFYLSKKKKILPMVQWTKSHTLLLLPQKLVWEILGKIHLAEQNFMS